MQQNVSVSGRGARLQPGETIAGRFVVIRFVARGGMGEVFEADDTTLRTRVALKTLLPSLSDDPSSLDRFRREVLLARSVSHPNICRVFDLHSTLVEGVPLHFLTMEFLEGESLAALLKRKGRLSTAEALPILRQTAAALDAAHARGVVHRDLKPSNVLLVPPSSKRDSGAERAVVTDFGIARALWSSRGEFETTGGTGTEGFLGTPDYVAPEQVSDKGQISEATDIFALGIVMYEMVTGELPFAADTPMKAVVRRLQDEPRPPARLKRDLPATWNAAILHCLQKDPAKRPRSAAAVVEEIETGPRHPPRSRRMKLGLVALVATLSVTTGGLLLTRYRQRLAQAGPEPVVAVLSLASQVPPSDVWLGPAITQLLGRELAEAQGVQLLPWRRVATAYPSLALDADQVLDESQKRRLYEFLPAQHFLEGSVHCPSENTIQSCQLLLTLKRQDGSSSATFEKNFSRGEVPATVASAGELIRRALGVRLGPAEATSLSARRDRPTAVLKLVGEGTAAYGRLDFRAARESFEHATSVDPTDYDAQSVLSQTLEQLGLFAEARHAAERAAAAAAANLSPGVRMATQARIDWLGNDPERAIASYRKLVQARPDDPDLVLALVRRLPSRAGLELLRRIRDLRGASSSDLELELELARLEEEEGHLDRANLLFDRVYELAGRLKPRRELSMLAELRTWDAFHNILPNLGSAEALALEAGDKQRAAYLHLVLSGAGRAAAERKLIAESLASFRGLQDRIGIHHALRRRAWAEDDWLHVRQGLERAAAELDGTDEPLSVAYHLNMAGACLHLGDLASARRSLDLATRASGQPSLSLVFSLPELPPLVNAQQLELDLLTEEDRIDDAEALARRVVHAQGHLCELKCARGQWASGAECFEQLLGPGPRTDRWGRALARCYWDAGNLERAEKAAWDANNRTIIDATDIASMGGGNLPEAQDSLEKAISSLRKDGEVLGALRTELVRATAEMRRASSAESSNFGFRPRSRTAWTTARRRAETVLAEAQRRDLPLLVRQARTTLQKELPPEAAAGPQKR